MRLPEKQLRPRINIFRIMNFSSGNELKTAREETF